MASAGFLFLFAADGRAKNIAQAGARIGRAIFLNSLFFFFNFQCLDGKRNASPAAIDLHQFGVELVAHCKAVGPLLIAVARQIGSPHEAGQTTEHFNVDALLMQRGDGTGDSLPSL